MAQITQVAQARLISHLAQDLETLICHLPSATAVVPPVTNTPFQLTHPLAEPLANSHHPSTTSPGSHPLETLPHSRLPTTARHPNPTSLPT